LDVATPGASVPASRRHTSVNIGYGTDRGPSRPGLWRYDPGTPQCIFFVSPLHPAAPSMPMAGKARNIGPEEYHAALRARLPWPDVGEERRVDRRPNQ
jgi:hypothetical protein